MGGGRGVGDQEHGAVAVVTGGAQGIGGACVDLFLERGHAVAVLDNDGEALQAKERQAPRGRGQLLTVTADVGREEEVNKAMARVREELGWPVDVLVNCAGTNVRGTVEEVDAATWERVLRTDLTSVYLTCRAVLPGMRQARSGVVVNVASVVGPRALERYSVYSAAKAGVVALTRSIALDYAPYGIRAVAVLPGATKTRLLAQDRGLTDPQEAARRMAHRLPLGRVAEPVEIARVITFLASPQASFVTGAAVYVDGGIGMRLPPESPSWPLMGDTP
jgi:NAD(P)-dependent dehydrogenase (short-subunit alcohol dehydrogenase family)